MTTPAPHHDALYRLAQVGTSLGVQLVRLSALVAGNRYQASAVEFAADGSATPAGPETFEVTNLAEPADAPGVVAPQSHAVALDVEGRWVIFVRPPTAAVLAARVVAALGAAAYTVRPQRAAATGSLEDQPAATDLTAWNLAELSLGDGAAVDVGTVVLVAAIAGPAAPRYVFDHPVYAKYLE